MSVIPDPKQPVRIDAWGVYAGYEDSAGRWRPTSQRTRAALHAAMGPAPARPRHPEDEPVRVVQAGSRPSLGRPGELILEDGTRLTVADRLPRDLPIGYHRLFHSGREQPQWLIVSPGTCYLPEDYRGWGWSVQLYALRSRCSWGLGDLADLRRFARWSSTHTSARVTMINPLCAATPVQPQQASPYYPSTKAFRNPLYLSIADLPGAAREQAALRRLADAGRALNAERHIDRDAIFKLKMAACGRLWKAFRPTPAFERYCAAQGAALTAFATFCALAERHGADWRKWPAALRQPESAAVQRFAAASADRIRFHQWLQWQLDEQLRRAGQHTALIADLPIGVDPAGADAWRWQHCLASGARVGAPPDRFNAQGQDWGLQPPVPHQLRAAGYAPFIEALRAGLRHAGGLRIDHVMGLFRLFWIPDKLTAQQGTYVAYPSEELLAVLAVESHRARAVIVGEDLGTVEARVRRELARRRVLGCALMWFERRPPARYRAHTLASITTHDLPTVAGVWSGADFHAQRELGLDPPEADYRRMRARLRQLTGLAERASVPDAVVAAHRALAGAASRLRVATLDDALGVAERPNLPGTTQGYPCWSLALPVPLEQIPRNPLVRAVAGAMAKKKPNQV